MALGKDIKAIKQFLIDYKNGIKGFNWTLNQEYFNSFSREYQAAILLEEMRHI